MTILVCGKRVQVVTNAEDREFMAAMLTAMLQTEKPVESVRSEGAVLNTYADGRITYDFVNEPGMNFGRV